MSRIVPSVLLFLSLLLVAGVAGASKNLPTCKNPRNAADSVFVWQLGDTQSLKNAARCFERTGRTQQQLEQAARHLKNVYDAKGAFVEMGKISEDPHFLNDDKNAQVTPHADLADVVIQKQGDQWVWTKASLDRIDRIYADTLGGLDQILDKLPAPLMKTVFDLALWQYLALVLLMMTGLVVRKIIQAVVASRIKRLAKRLGQQWTIKIVDVIASPGATLVTAIILRLGYPQLRLPIGVSSALAATVRLLITISVVWAVYRCVDLLSAKLTERAAKTESKLDDQLVPLLRKSLKVVVFIMGGLVVLQNLRFDVTTLLASVSIGTLAFGLAAKDTIANLFGSISIFVDSPFQIGDWIGVDGMDGTVEEVGFRSTRIRTFYNSVLVIPNAKLANAKIDNYGQRKYRRCFTTLGMTYDTTPEQMQAFVEGCRAIIQANEFTRKDDYHVYMSGFGDSSLNVMLYYFFRCDTWGEELRQKHNIYLEIMRLADSVGVAFAFPTQSVHIEAMPPVGERALSAPAESKQLGEIVHSYGPKGAKARP
ncbi:MAG: hypothetical protein DRI90_22850, partial [Deltaproteobacteria bacterium]